MLQFYLARTVLKFIHPIQDKRGSSPYILQPRRVALQRCPVLLLFSFGMFFWIIRVYTVIFPDPNQVEQVVYPGAAPGAKVAFS